MKRVSEFQNFSISITLYVLAFSSQVPVPTGLVTPGVPITTVTPSPPQKRRRLAIDRNIQIDADVIRRNVDTEGRETLRERVRNATIILFKRQVLGQSANAPYCWVLYIYPRTLN